MEYKSESEPPYDILSAIPSGESVLWKGRPSFWGLSWHIFGLKWIFLYLFILVIAFGFRVGVTNFQLALKYDFLPFFLSGLFAGIFLSILAVIQVYNTVYLVSEKRVVIKNGAALAFMISVPFKKIKSVNLQKRLGGLGTVSFELFSNKRVPYISCWPSVRPWLFKKPQPAFSCVSGVQDVADTIKILMTGGGAPLSTKVTEGNISKSSIEQEI
jgi:hypothetical protein